MRPMPVAAAAMQLGVSETVIHQCVQCGTLQAYKSDEGEWLVYQLDLAAMAELPLSSAAARLRAQLIMARIRLLEEEMAVLQQELAQLK